MAEDEKDVVPASPEIHFEPIVRLPLVETKTLEEDEETLFQMRARLYRYDSTAEPPEWKERGTGDVKIQRHKTEDYIRILMRRDKTLKICANHLIQPNMELKPNASSDKAWVWSVLADFADEEPKPELLAIRFGNVENAQKFKEAFQEATKMAEEFNKKHENDVNAFILDADQRESKSDSEEEEESSDAEDTTSPTKEVASNESDEITEKLTTLDLKKQDTSPKSEPLADTKTNFPVKENSNDS